MTIPAGGVRALTVEQLRDLMTCPISYELFQDPVTEKEGVCGGHTFERAWIEEWLIPHSECPLARTHLLATELIGNLEVREACRLLHPSRNDPLDEDDMEAIYLGAEVLLQRISPEEVPARVPQEIHDDIFDRISRVLAEAAGAYKTKAADIYGC